MTIGIYSLYWESQDLIYIGQSQNIERRYSEHIKKLKNNTHTNYKVQEAYTLYGMPKFLCVELCSIDRLDALEIFWTEEYNSLNSKTGLNIVPAGSSTLESGVLNINSRYSKLQVLKSFRCLYLGKDTYQEIYSKYGIKISNLNSIFSGKTHVWLKEKYPNLYAKMLCVPKRGIVKSINRFRNTSIKNPEGLIIPINTSYKIFAETHGLHPGHLSEVLNNKRVQHKGWKLP